MKKILITNILFKPSLSLIYYIAELENNISLNDIKKCSKFIIIILN